MLVGKAKLVPLNSSSTHCVVKYLLFYSEDTDHSYAASTLSDEEYAALLDAAMRFPDKQVRSECLSSVSLMFYTVTNQPCLVHCLSRGVIAYNMFLCDSQDQSA